MCDLEFPIAVLNVILFAVLIGMYQLLSLFFLLNANCVPSGLCRIYIDSGQS
jgi:hypothetical protein